MKRWKSISLCLVLLSAVSCRPYLRADRNLRPARLKAPIVPVQLQTAENPLMVTAVSQEEVCSCWATCGQMIMAYVRTQSPPWQSVPAPRQCEQTAQEYPDCCSACCTEQMTMKLWCSQPGLPEFTDRWHFSCKTNSAQPLSLEEIKEEIDNHRPVAFSWRDGNNFSHMMVLIGYDSEHQTVTYLDPEYGKTTGVKVDLLSKYQNMQNPVHELDFYNIQVKGTP